MPRKPTPYVQNPQTGESLTREFVKRFLKQYTGPVVEAKGTKFKTSAPSIVDAIFGGTASPQEPLYPTVGSDLLQRTIGRAARVPAGRNPHEYLWCVKADITLACRKLDTQSRRVLGLKYIGDLSDYTIAEMLRLSPIAVYRIVEAALDRLAILLDQSS